MLSFQWMELGLLGAEIAELQDRRHLAEMTGRLSEAQQAQTELSQAEERREELVASMMKTIIDNAAAAA